MFGWCIRYYENARRILAGAELLLHIPCNYYSFGHSRFLNDIIRAGMRTEMYDPCAYFVCVPCIAWNALFGHCALKQTLILMKFNLQPFGT